MLARTAAEIDRVTGYFAAALTRAPAGRGRATRSREGAPSSAAVEVLDVAGVPFHVNARGEPVQSLVFHQGRCDADRVLVVHEPQQQFLAGDVVDGGDAGADREQQVACRLREAGRVGVSRKGSPG